METSYYFNFISLINRMEKKRVSLRVKQKQSERDSKSEILALFLQSEVESKYGY